MNTPVTFNLAKLLKEKGFDYHSLYNDFANEYDYFDRSVQGRLHVSDFPEDKFPDENKWIPVPYIHQVVMWLYEKHGIWINVRLASGYFWWEISTTDKNLSPLGMKEYSPTEAYEAAIEYTLKNLL